MTDAAPQPFFHIERIYLQDISLEQPHSPQIFLETALPSSELHVQIDVNPLQESFFQTSLTLTLTSKIEQKTALIVELKQAGIFNIQNFLPDEMGPMLYINCPSILFGYARANLADLIMRAGFPPIHLNEVDFHALYQHRIAENTPSTPSPESSNAATQE